MMAIGKRLFVAALLVWGACKASAAVCFMSDCPTQVTAEPVETDGCCQSKSATTKPSGNMEKCCCAEKSDGLTYTYTPNPLIRPLTVLERAVSTVNNYERNEWTIHKELPDVHEWGAGRRNLVICVLLC